MTIRINRRTLLGGVGLAAIVLAGCSDTDPLDTDEPAGGEDPQGNGGSGGGVITVGSAGFAENEIIAELYAQALENEGFTVERRMQIGARDAYYKALEDGSIDLVPEYTGNLLQFLDPDSDAADPEEIDTELVEALPEDLRVLDPAEAENKDAWCVTAEFSEQNQITSLADLSSFDGKLRLAGNPELAERPYGPPGLSKIYGVPEKDLDFTPIDDGGGPLTVQALVSGDVDMVNIFTTTPAISEENFVVLDDPENMIIPQNVVPLLSSKVPADAEEILNNVSAALTTDDLIDMNARNQGDEKASPDVIAKEWLSDQGLTK